MAAMPYYVEKGPVFSVYESYLESLDHRLALLENLRDKSVPVWDVIALKSQTLAGMGNLAAHTRDHWHGTPTFDGTNWVQPAGATTTGWWQRWQGPSEKILRETFLRAVEVSLGIDHVAASATWAMPKAAAETAAGPFPATPTPRCWPIEFIWICGTFPMQGWVTWRQHGTDWSKGQVTVLLLTPGPDMTKVGPKITGGVSGNMLSSPRSGLLNPATYPDYDDNPGTWADVLVERGMWMIGGTTGTNAVDTAQWQATTITGITITLTIELPTSRVVTADDVIVVRPTEEEGGVLNTGRKYVK
jgi:hypothetical protein